ncbi:hypothetical protein [Intestinirhabdus alba]|uniref:Uncharacterized protein n=1 Tax=Intestinirhabdus alba TaxID=2899544 RepID=A0A6L6IQ34_9ENTR|nr:hypothetical protein [Intestinirhabdus alba]MTH47110.1 hypothetical protein [Intestinirhabdus alba]
MPSSPVNQDTLDFVLSNLAVIKEIQDTKLRAIDAFFSEGKVTTRISRS